MSTPLDTIQPKFLTDQPAEGKQLQSKPDPEPTPQPSPPKTRYSSHNLIVFLVFSLLTPLLGYYTLAFVLLYYLFSWILRHFSLKPLNKSQEVLFLGAYTLLFGACLNFLYHSWYTLYPTLTYPGGIILGLVTIMTALVLFKRPMYIQATSILGVTFLLYMLAVVVTPPTLTALVGTPNPPATYLLLALLAVIGVSLPSSLPLRSYSFAFPFFIVVASLSLTAVSPEDLQQLFSPLLGDLARPLFLIVITTLALTTLPQLSYITKPLYPLVIGVVLVSIFLPYTSIIYIAALLGVLAGVRVLQQLHAPQTPSHR